MFEDTLRELNQLGNGIQMSIDMRLDDDRYFDRKCPDPICEADFG